MPAGDSISALDRRLTAAIRGLGERIGPLEQSASEQKVRHDIVVGKLDDIQVDVCKIGDATAAVNKRCDDLHTRLVVVEVAWTEQMKPGLERLRNLELKVAGAAILGGAFITTIAEVLKVVIK